LKTNGAHHKPANIFQVIGQSFQIAQRQNQTTWREACDLVIEPDTMDYNWDEFARAEELIRAGERAAQQALPALQALTHPQALPQLVAAE
jgi:predicted acylesterase/phospholipase RssA